MLPEGSTYAVVTGTPVRPQRPAEGTWAVLVRGTDSYRVCLGRGLTTAPTLTQASMSVKRAGARTPSAGV